MISVRRADDRGHFDFGWLDTRHTFSFGQYHDPEHMGFRSLRVINEDRVAAGAGFPTHSHRDMEILSYVLEGGLTHRDSTGTTSVIRPGEVQRMSAGTGVTHSEHNASKGEPVHFLQIWIVPERHGLPPGYEQKAFPAAERRGRLRVLASPNGRKGSVTVHQDVSLHGALLDAGESVTHKLAAGRHAWIQMAHGTAAVNDTRLAVGDGAAITGAGEITISAEDSAQVLVFDLA